MSYIRAFFVVNLLTLAVAVCRMRDTCSLEVLSGSRNGLMKDSCGSVWRMNRHCKPRLVRNENRCSLRDPCAPSKYIWGSIGHYIGTPCGKIRRIDSRCRPIPVLIGRSCVMWDTCAKRNIHSAPYRTYKTACGDTVRLDSHCRVTKIRAQNRCRITDRCNRKIIWENIGVPLLDDCGHPFRIDQHCRQHVEHFVSVQALY